MAKILSFRNKDGAATGQPFEADESEKLSFQIGEDGATRLTQMPQDSLPSPLPDPRRDWSNQELADLYRVRQLLAGAGVPVDTLRGVTDEGDPWFVFCHLNGDVFIHMARIDGAYVLDSPNAHRPLRGRDFNELIADFTSDALPTRAAAGDADHSQRVVRLERGGKVRLHPSAMLAALIWTLFMAAEDLVMLIQNEEALPSDDLLDFSDIISADHQPDLAALETADIESLSTQHSEKELIAEMQHQGQADGQGHHGQVREALSQQSLAMHQNAYAMGLSTIAIAMGFMSEAVLMDNQRKVLDGLSSLGFSQYAAAEGAVELEQTTEADSGLIEMLAEFLGLDLSLNTEMAEAQGQKANGALVDEAELHLSTASVTDDALTKPKSAQQVLQKAEADELSEAPIDTAAAAMADDPAALIALAIAQQEEDMLTMDDLLAGQHQLEEFQLGQTTVMASFDLTQSDAISFYMQTVNQRKTDHRAFDDRAQSFIDYVHAKDTEVGIITFGNEIIMIDRAAFQQSGAETYTFSWETHHGQVISMIGLRAEFQEFDLIA